MLSRCMTLVMFHGLEHGILQDKSAIQTILQYRMLYFITQSEQVDHLRISAGAAECILCNAGTYYSSTGNDWWIVFQTHLQLWFCKDALTQPTLMVWANLCSPHRPSTIFVFMFRLPIKRHCLVLHWQQIEGKTTKARGVRWWLREDGDEFHKRVAMYVEDEPGWKKEGPDLWIGLAVVGRKVSCQACLASDHR